MHELYYGAYKSERQEHGVGLVDALLFEVLEFDSEDGRHAGEIRAALARQGRPIGPYDVLIAGQARARDLTLVTANVGEFRRVEGLRVENWSQG
jgi:tRNA(fMet)-specific endonuclease VapC